MGQDGEDAGRVVIADAGPLHSLVLIDAASVLPALFGAVVLPDQVLAELSRPRTPARVRAWVAALPAWAEPRATPPAGELPHPELGDGERAAIALAREARRGSVPVLLLIDDRLAVTAARAEGFGVTGTIGVLEDAARESLVDLPAAFDRLRATNFRYPPALLMALLQEHRAATKDASRGA